jgi:hypothetical protein
LRQALENISAISSEDGMRLPVDMVKIIPHA